MHQKEYQEEIVTPKQQQVQKKEQTKSPKDHLKTFTQQTILKINNIGLYQIFQMPIQQLQKFRDGLQAYYQQETILAAIVNKLAQRRINQQKEDEKVFNQKSVKQQNQLKMWTIKTANKIINTLCTYKQLSQKKCLRFRCGLRKYFPKETYLFHMINNMMLLKFYLESKDNETSEKYKSQEQQQVDQLIFQIVQIPFLIQSTSEQRLIYIKDVLKKYYSKEILFQKIIQIFLKRKKQNYSEQGPSITETTSKRSDQLEAWTKQFFLQAIYRPIKLYKKDVKLLSKFKVGLERNFDKEISLIKIVQNLITDIQKSQAKFLNKKEQSILSSLHKKVERGVNKITSIGLFNYVFRNKKSKVSQSQTLYLIQTNDLQEQSKSNQ